MKYIQKNYIHEIMYKKLYTGYYEDAKTLFSG